MFLPPGQAVTVEFQAQAGATAIALESPVAVVVRDGVDTAVVTEISFQGSGRYVVSFAVPSNWVFPQRVSVRLSGGFNGLAAQLTKAIGQVGNPAAQVWEYSGGDRGLSGAQANALLAESRRKRIDFAASTLTLFAADGVTPLQVFDLQDADGNPADTPATAE